jgi:hypothetical protein
MRAEEVAFVGGLVYQFPVLAPILQEHLDDYDGLLPHVLLGEVTRWIVAEFAGSGPSVGLRNILEFIESSFRSGSNDGRELIAVSFLENLPRREESSSEILNLLGPQLTAQLQAIE